MSAPLEELEAEMIRRTKYVISVQNYFINANISKYRAIFDRERLHPTLFKFKFAGIKLGLTFRTFSILLEPVDGRAADLMTKWRRGNNRDYYNNFKSKNLADLIRNFFQRFRYTAELAIETSFST